MTDSSLTFFGEHAPWWEGFGGIAVYPPDNNGGYFQGHTGTPQGPYVALIGANSLYVAGDFTEVNGMPQPGFVQFPVVR